MEKNEQVIYAPMPDKIEGLLFKKVQNKLKRIFKKVLPRWCVFDLKKQEFSYRASQESKKVLKCHKGKNIINYTSNVDLDDNLNQVYKYGFKLFTAKRGYVLFLDNKELYDQWMRVLNFYFYNIDILKKEPGKSRKYQPYVYTKQLSEVIPAKEDKENSIVNISSERSLSNHSEKLMQKFQIENLLFGVFNKNLEIKDSMDFKKKSSQTLHEKSSNKEGKRNSDKVVTEYVTAVEKDFNKKKVNIKESILNSPDKKAKKDKIERNEEIDYEKIQNNQKDENLDFTMRLSGLSEISVKENAKQYDELGREIIMINNNNEYKILKRKNEDEDQINANKTTYVDSKILANFTKQFLSKEENFNMSFNQINHTHKEKEDTVAELELKEEKELQDINEELHDNLLEGEKLVNEEMKINNHNLSQDKQTTAHVSPVATKEHGFVDDLLNWEGE
jgi:hypothetical protein